MAQKTNPETLGRKADDFIKWEATPLTRVEVPATKGLKAGEFVEYALRSKKYIALTDEKDLKVVIQPHNCVMDLQYVKNTDVTKHSTNLETLKKDGDAYGIVYQNSPAA